ncbi:MAG: UbiA family prenyltransferase [Deltaproteobacteria bacterium]|nr:UbiA family prenyltransferase [Deltaproteobacteria bacterium]
MSTYHPKILALDLDGTLLGTDSLWELFFKGLSLGRISPLLWLLTGRLSFKRRLAETVDLDLALLPWNPKVIELALAHKAKGGEVWLATAANEAMAKKVVAHFDFFSGYMGSDRQVNLKSAAKALELSRRFGPGKFIYAGDSGADVAVWREAGGAVVVGSEKLAGRAEPRQGRVETVPPVGTKSPSPALVLKTARAGQWVNNLWLLVPLLAAGLSASSNLAQAALALVVFCLYSSAASVAGDLLSVESDRRSPKTRQSPFASGALDLSRGGFIFLGSLLVGLSASLFLGWAFFFLALLHLFFSIIYSLSIKNRFILDAVAFALLFVVRLLAGSAAMGVRNSLWLILFSFFLFASLGLVKRLISIRSRTPAEEASAVAFQPFKIAESALVKFLCVVCICATAPTLLVFASDEAAWSLYGRQREIHRLLLLLCAALFYWLVRFLKMADAGRIGREPLSFLRKDKISWICLGLGAVVLILDILAA